MKKSILITGSTDGIGLATAKTLASLGHDVILHGRSESKLALAKAELAAINGHGKIDAYRADLSSLAAVVSLANAIQQDHQQLDVLINNAGVYTVSATRTVDDLDLRFVVNTIAPYLLTQRLRPILAEGSRVVNLSSAAQAAVNPIELSQQSTLDNGTVYAKSKLALTMWSRHLADKWRTAPAIIAVNPASFLGTKMVKEAYGRAGGDLQQGADILVKAALSAEFAKASGLYFDNDIGRFASPHPDALDQQKCLEISQQLDSILQRFKHD